MSQEHPETDTAFAHSANGAGHRHPLREHLHAVGNLSAEFAAGARWASEAKLAGFLHDLGKYGDRFQARLQGRDQGLDHWSPGASVALTRFRAVAAALATQGHHIGLQRGSTDSLRRLLSERLSASVLPGLALSDPDLERLQSRAANDGLEFTAPQALAVSSWTHAVAAMLDVRMLFSCLVDADFLDTEAHFEGDAQGKRYRPKGLPLDAGAAMAALDSYMAQLRMTNQADTNVRQARASLWKAVVGAGEAEIGVFTLTAPTGSGKTLAMLRFALCHAARHGLKRIVLAVPFLTIIEQTANNYREVFRSFPENFVLEHHSLAGLGAEETKTDNETGPDRQRRLLAENWDAPIVLTTNVQLLESLFSNRPSACRKLHNLMESVILFDEAQSLPAGFAVPTLAALSHLAAAYRSSVVFATATQPAFDTLHEAVTKHAVSGWRPVEAVPEHAQMFDVLRRVVVRWPTAGEKLAWSELATRLRGTDQALVVVNLKRHALALMTELDGVDGVFHLSTNLCAEHRMAVLDQVRARLAANLPCRLVSTQCVEAGVDLDFPRVFRAMAPLESIAQAAGRCNREGRMTSPGEVIVFEVEEDDGWRRRYPTHAYYQAAEVTRTLLNLNGDLDIGDPRMFRIYYRRLYDLSDPANQSPELAQAIDGLDFAEIARLYRLIETNAIQVLVPWSGKRQEFERLRSVAEREGISTGWIRGARGIAVSVYRTQDGPPAWAIPAKLRRCGVSGVSGESNEWFILEGEYYDNALGLNPPSGEQVFIA